MQGTHASHSGSIKYGTIHAYTSLGSAVRLAREAEERQAQLERLAVIGQMMASIAHESRNSLQRIQIAADMLALDLGDLPRASKDLARIRQGAKELAVLLEEVREFSAPIQWDRSQCDLSDIWRTAWDKATVVGNEDAPFLLEQCDASTSICGDEFRLEQAFRNLFENSLQACQSAPHVALHCATTELYGHSALMIAIRDNGTGLTATDVKHVFEPFFSTKKSGTGLGLAIVKRIIDGHGGRIEIGADQNPGAEILITLPTSDESDSARSAAAELALTSDP